MKTSNMVILLLACQLTLYPDSLQISLEPNLTNSDASSPDYPTIRNMTETTPKPKTLEDFIILTINELGLLRMRTKIIRRGYFLGKYLIIEDGNQTQYLFPLFRQNNLVTDIKDKLDNHSGDGEICVGGVCLSVEQTRERLAELEALQLGRVRPKQLSDFAIMTTVVCLVIILGVTGNLLIITSVLKESKLRNSTSVLLCCLAVADVLVLGICLPLQIVNHFVPFAYLNMDVCRLVYFVRNFSVVSSTLTMAAMAVDRYIAIRHPLRARSYCTVNNARYFIILIWVLSVAISCPVVFFVRIYESIGVKYCLFLPPNVSSQIAYYVIMLVVVLVIPLCIMVPTYCKIFCVLWRSTSETKALQSAKSDENGAVQKNRQDSDTIKSRLQVIRMLVVVLLVFTLCWGPTTLVDAFRALRYPLFGIKQSVINPDVSFVLYTIAICNSFFNPIIYFSMSRQFRQFVLSTCKKPRRTTKSTSFESSQAKTMSESVSQTLSTSTNQKTQI